MRKKVKRRAVMQNFAEAHGLQFKEKDDYGLMKYFKQINLFKYAGQRGVTNVVFNHDNTLAGPQFGLLDYTYVVSTGQTTVVIEQTVYYGIDKSIVLPHFKLFPEKWYHSIGKWFGAQDINFAEYPEFSRKFMLKSDDENFTSMLFRNPEVTEFMLERPDWWVEAVGYYVTMYRPGKLQKEGDLQEMLEQGNALNALLRKALKSL